MKKKGYVENDIDWINETAESLWKIFNDNTDMISESLGIPHELLKPNTLEELDKNLIGQSFELINNADYIYRVNSIKSSNLGTKVTCNLLKKEREKNYEQYYNNT